MVYTESVSKVLIFNETSNETTIKHQIFPQFSSVDRQNECKNGIFFVTMIKFQTTFSQNIYLLKTKLYCLHQQFPLASHLNSVLSGTFFVYGSTLY